VKRGTAMARTRKLLLKILGIVAAIAAIGLTGHFLIRALIAMHAG
jgi:hypothetical protein